MCAVEGGISAATCSYAAAASSSQNEATYIERVVDQVLAHAGKHFEAGKDILHVVMHVRLDQAAISQRLRTRVSLNDGLARHADRTAKGAQGYGTLVASAANRMTSQKGPRPA